MQRGTDCQKTSLKTCATEQRGVCAGGKKPTARSIKQDFETFFESFKIRTAWRKDFFDTLIPAAFAAGNFQWLSWSFGALPGTWESSTPEKTSKQPKSSVGVRLWRRISQPKITENTDSRLINREATVGSV